MTPRHARRPREPRPRALGPNETNALGESAHLRENDRGAAPLSSAHRSDDIARSRRHRTRMGRRFSERPRLRQLGPVEYTLLALIVLGVAVTVAMAIFNPSA
jgi:hypothetical protein